MAGLTRSLVTRHALGRADVYDAALLDVAQDHLLYLLAEAGMFTDGQLVFKGGTSLRKCRLGNDGRFSTDLDFAAPNEDTVLQVCGVIDGARVAGFEYRLESTRGDGRHWGLRVNHPDLGTPDISASVEFARRPLALSTDTLAFIPLPIHKHYGFALPALPVVAEAEACAEKLARYRRVALGRDLYDLHQFANRTLDEPLVRRLWVLKVWGDVVDDSRGTKPADPDEVLHHRRERDYQPDSIGVLTRPVDIAAWEARVRKSEQSCGAASVQNLPSTIVARSTMAALDAWGSPVRLTSDGDVTAKPRPPFVTNTVSSVEFQNASSPNLSTCAELDSSCV